MRIPLLTALVTVLLGGTVLAQPGQPPGAQPQPGPAPALQPPPRQAPPVQPPAGQPQPQLGQAPRAQAETDRQGGEGEDQGAGEADNDRPEQQLVLADVLRQVS